MKGQSLLTQHYFTTHSCGRPTSPSSSASSGLALSQASSRVSLAALSCRHSLVPSPVLSPALSHAPSHAPSSVPSHESSAPSCAPSITPLPESSSAQATLWDPLCAPVPSGLPWLEVSSSAAGGEEEEGYDLDKDNRDTEFLLDTEEDSPMMTEKDKSEI